jgi:LuxR family maltose regulon positive regulatory protein
VAVHIAVAASDTTGARTLLDDWPEESEPRPAIDRLICEAIVADQSGDSEDAMRQLSLAVRRAAPDGHMRIFLDAGEPAARLLGDLYLRRPSPYLRRLSEQAALVNSSSRTVKGLVEQLSARELVVLSYLPSRYSNPEIAARLYVSTNTVKTHLKHIYRKLQVNGRNEAVEAAAAYGLL